jgi:hypothetical protein
MNTLTINIPADLAPLIEDVEDRSDELMSRLWVIFTNGYGLSIIRGEYSYGYEQGLFEIAPINKHGELDGDLFDEDDQGDDVLGHADPEKINYYMRKLALLPA